MFPYEHVISIPITLLLCVLIDYTVVLYVQAQDKQSAGSTGRTGSVKCYKTLYRESVSRRNVAYANLATTVCY